MSEEIYKYIKQIPTLTHEEEIELGKRIQAGDKAALKILVEHNLRLVLKISVGYKTHLLTTDDLVQEGVCGLIAAAEKYDHTKGYKFSTYAVWWINQRITRAIYCYAPYMRVPNHVGQLAKKIFKASQELERELQRIATPAEIAERLGIDEKKVLEVGSTTKNSVSYDAKIEGPANVNDRGGSKYFIDVIEDTTAADPARMFEETEKALIIEEMLKDIPERDAEVVRLLFGLRDQTPRSLNYVAQQFGISRERVRQIKVKVINRLKRKNKRVKLKGYE